MTARVAILSVHPQWAQRILDGTKTVELRRQRLPFESGTRLVLYATSPEQRLVGEVTVDAVEAFDVEYATHGDGGGMCRAAGVTSAELHSYLRGLDEGYAIHLRNPRRWPLGEQIHTSELREYLPNWHPPQTFRWVPEGALLDAINARTA